MSKKIEKLTEKQELEMVAFREKWRKIGLSTDRVDKEATKEAIVEMYKLLGKKEPQFIFVPSPFFANLQINFCSKVVFPKIKEKMGANLRDNLWANLRDNLRANLGANLGANLRDNLGANLRDNLWANLRDNLRANLGANLRDNLWDNLWDNLRANLGANLWANLGANLRDNLGDNLGANLGANLRDNLGANLRDNLWDNLWDNLRANLGANLWANLGANLRDNLGDNALPEELREYHGTYFLGQMDSAFVAFYKFPELKLGLQYAKGDSQLLELWARVAKSACWWWPYENYVFVSDRPAKLNFNKRYQLHDEHGPAYEFSDGWKAYYLNGVKFPEELYKKVISREMAMDEVLKITDIDQRVQAMKFAKTGLREFYISQKGKKVDEIEKLDSKMRPVHYELWKILAGEIFNQEVAFAIYDCPSSIERGEKREYAKGVPVKYNTVAEAIAWGMGEDGLEVTKEEFLAMKPLVDEA